ncbi:hypothetical protein J5N97_007480 [Dioscorea zingiberensis]|uniref:RING-type E3 ubiquitin transferase n=1 Tax=Dioscorea zingiberensis TaxID=325984 RepID=A0A9D5DDA2_9LILI|nr:hypothetical protein J5N97_007480 [Dioscorea zingiberensis]
MHPMAKRPRLEAARAATLVHYLFFILFYFFMTLVSAKQDECTPSCGNLSISYPLRLKGDPSYCGDPNPNFELTCDSSNHTFLNRFSAKFYIDGILPGNEYLLMHATDVRMEKGGCSLPQPSMTFTKVMSSDFPYLTYSLAWATFVNCSKEVKNNPMYSPVSCLSQNGTFIYVVISDYPGYQGNTVTVGDLVTSCSFLSMSPVDPHLVGLNYPLYPYSGPSLKRVNLVNCTKEVVNNSMYWHVPCLRKNGSFIYLISHSQEHRNIDLSTSCRFFTLSPQDASVLTMHANFSSPWLVNCSKEVKNNRKYMHLPCLSRDAIFIYLVTFLDDSADLASSCEPLLMSPLDFASINYGQSGIFELLSRGFQLQWGGRFMFHAYEPIWGISDCLGDSLYL